MTNNGQEGHNPFIEAQAAKKANGNPRPLNRRDFLRGGVAVGIALSSSSLLAAERALTSRRQQEPWLTLAKVQAILLPSDGNGPGAEDIHGLSYLFAVTEQPQLTASERKFIFDGVGWVNDFSQQRHQRRFSQLDNQQQQQLIGAINRSKAGGNWLSNQVGYLLEAMLSSPVYGGNIDQQGWKWLQHSGGYPQPDSQHSWHRLAQRR